MILLKLFIKRLALTILLLPLIVLPAAYILIQTKQGAIWISQILSSSDHNYQISIEKINLAVTHPLRIELMNLKVKRNGNNLINVKEADLIFRATGSSNWLHYLEFKNGTINIKKSALDDVDLNSEWLILNNINLNILDPEGDIIFERVHGEVSPWSPLEKPFHNSIFQMSALKVTGNEFAIEHLLLVGRMQQGRFILDSFGLNLPQGEVTGRLFKDSDSDWVIENLYLNKFGWQSDQTIQQLYQQLESLPPLDIRQLDVMRANIEGEQWALNEVNLSLNNIKWKEGQWTALADSKINFMADSVLFEQVYINDPIIKLKLNNHDIEIQQINARWQGGLIKASGLWRNNILTLDDVIISAIEYTLPENWQSLVNYQFPDWLQTININSLITSRNVIIDTNSRFPFQLTFLDIDGKNLRLVQEQRFNLWQGNLKAYAHDGTFNQIDVRYPLLVASADEQQIHFSKLSGFVDHGVIDGQLTLSQNNNHSFQFEFNGENVPVNLLHQWGWQQPLPFSGNSAIKLNLSQHLDSSSLNGVLELTSSQGKKVTQYIPQNQAIPVVTAPGGASKTATNTLGEVSADIDNQTKQHDIISQLDHFVGQAQRIILNSHIPANIAATKTITSDNPELNNTNAGPGQIPANPQPMPNNALPMIRGASIFLALGN